jgi:hypothetical protein
VQGEDGGQSPSCFFGGESLGGALTGSGANASAGLYSHGLPLAHCHMGRLSGLMAVEASRVQTVGVAMDLALTQVCEKKPNQAMETMRRKSWTTGGWKRSQTSTENAARAERTCRTQGSRAAPKDSHLFFLPPIQLSTFNFSLFPWGLMSFV